MTSDALLVGVCGGSGSGKTTLINNIIQETGDDNVCLISLDNYYLPKEQQLKDPNGKINFDLPTSLDQKRIVQDIEALQKGQAVTVKEYNFNTAKSESILVLEPKPILLIEGLFVFHYPDLREKLHHKIFIDVHPEIQLQRRINRDVRERGYPEHEVVYQWNHHVMPSYKKYLEPYKSQADIVISNNVNFERGWDECCELIQKSFVTG